MGPPVSYGNSKVAVVALVALSPHFIYLFLIYFLSVTFSALKGSKCNSHFHLQVYQIPIDFPKHPFSKEYISVKATRYRDTIWEWRIKV